MPQFVFRSAKPTIKAMDSSAVEPILLFFIMAFLLAEALAKQKGT
jgi:hypothetical protein